MCEVNVGSIIIDFVWGRVLNFNFLASLRLERYLRYLLKNIANDYLIIDIERLQTSKRIY